MKMLAPLALFLVAFTLSTPLVRGDDEKGGIDEQFYRKAAAINVAEVKLGELAEKNAKNAEVKEFARHMIKDHSKHNKELAQRAKGLKAAVVIALDKAHQEKIDRLSKLEGAEFDRAYMKEMVDGHQEAIKLFEKEAKSGINPDLKSFATESLPILRTHLKKAQNIADNLK